MNRTLNRNSEQKGCDFMNAHKYLQRIKVLDTKIKNTEERIETLKAAASGAGSIRYDKERVQTSMIDSKLESLVLQYIELEDKVMQMKARKKHLIQTALMQIDNLSSDKDQRILKMIYIDFMSYNKIARYFDVSRWTIYRWRDEALEHFSDTNKDIVS